MTGVNDKLAFQIDEMRAEHDPEHRFALLAELVMAGGESLWPHVEELLRSRRDEDRAAGFELAGALPLRDDDDRTWQRAEGSPWADVDSFSAKQRETLARYAAAALEESHDTELLLDAITAAGKQKLAATLPQLLTHVDHDDPDVREAVAVALGHLSGDVMPERSVAALVRLARDPDDAVRGWALFSLRLGDGGNPVDTPEARAAYWDNVDSPDPDVREEAITALGLLGQPDMLTCVIENYRVDLEAIEVARRLADPRLLEPLEALRERGWAQSKDPDISRDLEARLERAIAASTHVDETRI
jgi:hypothetical protein